MPKGKPSGYQGSTKKSTGSKPPKVKKSTKSTRRPPRAPRGY